VSVSCRLLLIKVGTSAEPLGAAPFFLRVWEVFMRVGLAAVAVALLAFGCSEQSSPAAPDITPSFAAGGGLGVELRDRCDAATFNAALGAGTCVNTNGGIRFDQFIAILTNAHKVGAWSITPATLSVEEGTTVPVTNVGGEEHTFTEVEDFGGGVVPLLNQLAGVGDITPECAAIQASDRIKPGQTVQHLFDEEGIEKYQCCIHPWMRQIVRARE
jgi:plastocyanin